MLTVADLRAQLAQYPDAMEVLALDGLEVLDIDAVTTIMDELRCHQAMASGLEIQALLLLRLKPSACYVSLSHFA
jgi:hypothetical protein